VVESAKLSVVDLAGSERNKNTQATGKSIHIAFPIPPITVFETGVYFDR
jgi:hypothetical protein